MPFSSFLQGGFEACFALDKKGKRFDLLAETRHDEHLHADYARLQSIGISTVRESLSWNQIDRGDGRYDFSRFERYMRAARDTDTQIIWSLNHFDVPENVDAYAPEFVERFAAYALAALRTIRRYDRGTLYLNPINEISYFSWYAGDLGAWAPFGRARGAELKQQFVRAALAAIRAIRAVDDDVRFIHVDPVLWRKPAPGADHAAWRYAADFANAIFQAWDMLSGRVMPELGGSPDCIDIVGVNYYFENQDEVLSVSFPPHAPFGEPHTAVLPLDHPRRLGLDYLLHFVWQRYGKPVLVTETGCYGNKRVPWWTRIFPEIDRAIALGVPLLGVCAYPIIDRRDWHGGHLTNSGFWDFVEGDAACTRVPYEPVLDVVRAYRQLEIGNWKLEIGASRGLPLRH